MKKDCECKKYQADCFFVEYTCKECNDAYLKELNDVMPEIIKEVVNEVNKNIQA